MNYLSQSFEDVFGVEYPYTKTDIDRVIMEQCLAYQTPVSPSIGKTKEEQKALTAHARKFITQDVLDKKYAKQRANGCKTNKITFADGKEYHSLGAAARAFDINKKTAYNRVRSENYPGWYQING